MLSDISPFLEYRKNLSQKGVILLSQKELNKFKVIRPADNSRYFEKGRKRIKAKIFSRLGSWSNAQGVLLTCTFDPKKIGREEAWAYVGAIRRKFLDRLNAYRRKKGWAKAKGCFVLEVQPGTGYPHLHGCFPKLQYLASKEEINRAWAFGYCDIRYKDNFSPTGYVLKYITKMNHWQDEHFSYCWLYGTRLYSLSRDYSLPSYADKKVPEWKFYSCDSIQALSWWWLSGKHLLQRVREGPVPFGNYPSSIDLSRGAFAN